VAAITLGHPEGELAIAQAVIYLATAPKSNAAYKAFGAAMRAAKEGGSLLPTFYDPPDRGFEREIRRRLDYWAKLRKERG
jgi:putative ATPase